MADFTSNLFLSPDNGARHRGSISASLENLQDINLLERQTIAARVTAVTTVSASERLQLLQLKLQAAGLPLSTRESWSRLLAAPDLKLLTLNLQGKTLFALSDQPLRVGQTLAVSSDRSGQLQLAGLLGPAPLSQPTQNAPASIRIGASTSASSAVLPTPGEPLAPAAAKARLQMGEEQQTRGTSDAGPVARFHGALEQQLRTELASAVRRSLPLARSPEQLFRATTQLGQGVNGTPPEERSPSLVPALAQATQLLKLAPTWSEWQSRPVAALLAAAQTFGLPPTAGAEHAPAEVSVETYQAALLSLATALKPAEPAAVVNTVQEDTDTGLDEILWQLLKQNQQPERPAGEKVHSLVARQLTQLIEAATARLELHRAGSLLNQSQASVQSQHAHAADIPIRFGEHVFGNILLQLQEFRVDERPDRQSNKKKQQKSKWLAYLELTLGGEEGLAVELSMVDRKLEATLWCQNEPLYKQSVEGLQQLKCTLEAEGLEVTDLRCLSQRPPARPSAIGVSLIDEKS